MIPIVDRLTAFLLRHQLPGASLLQRTLNAADMICETRYGQQFHLRPDYIDGIVIREGYYESEVLDELLRQLPPNGTLWDVGANFGLHAITVKALRADARVICFEPSPDQAARVLRNAALNKVSVEVVCLGLGDTAKLAPLHVIHAGNPGMTTFHPWDGAKYDQVLYSPMDSGDNLIAAGLPFPDVIKLDIEGGESAAITGLQKTLALGRTSLLFEGSGCESDSLRTIGFPVVTPLSRKEDTAHALTNFSAPRWS
jgi:FkbM family methyltransferase